MKKLAVLNIYIYTCTIYDKDEQIEMMILIRMMTMMTIIMICIYNI